MNNNLSLLWCIFLVYLLMALGWVSLVNLRAVCVSWEVEYTLNYVDVSTPVKALKENPLWT